jgi:hypothetical protein
VQADRAQGNTLLCRRARLQWPTAPAYSFVAFLEEFLAIDAIDKSGLRGKLPVVAGLSSVGDAGGYRAHAVRF